MFVVLMVAMPGVASGHHGKYREPNGKTLIAIYPALYQQAKKDPKVYEGRDVLAHGRAKDGRLEWALVRSESRRLWRAYHPKAERARKFHVRSLAYGGGAKGLGYAVTLDYYEQRGVPQQDAEAQWSCLYSVIRRESGWNHRVWNHQGSGAYGLGQALPASKMAAYGSDYMTNPATQVRWAIGYAYGRYGSPCGAWAFWQVHHYW